VSWLMRVDGLCEGLPPFSATIRELTYGCSTQSLVCRRWTKAPLGGTGSGQRLA
jgi:hypothetical protein